jgi:asparagine synthase (glutamine-hydrolysing)
MCGVAGYFGMEVSADGGSELLRRMCDVIRHRGPDDEGYFVDDGVGLGMRRLSIVDLAGGHQPMENDDGTKHVVFNGEIYNHAALRGELQARGYRFRTVSDTEVILRAFEAYGPECVHRFNGMFAFAIWDAATRTLFLARDRLGVKPLYYTWNGRALVFASEIKCLRVAGRANGVNRAALSDFLMHRYVPGPHSIWSDVRKLQPGHHLTITAARRDPVVTRYWSPPPQSARPSLDDDRHVAEFTELFEDAVRLRLIADVPVGVLLSGGLDSTAVLAAARHAARGPVQTFSVGFSGGYADDERVWARKAARALGAQHHEIEIGDEAFVRTLPQLVNLTDEPLADLASIPLFHVSRLASERVKVVLSGEGSDEILGGYDLDRMMRRAWVLQAYRALPGQVRARLPPLMQQWPRLHSLAEEGASSHEDWIAMHPPTMVQLMSRAAAEDLLLPPSETDRRTAQEDVALNELRGAPAGSPLSRLLYAYQQSWLVEDLLMKADRMTMGNSIELRVPFLDYRLVEWAARTPDCAKVHRVSAMGWETKWVLRRFCDGRVPPEIVRRPKKGFPMPAYARLPTAFKPWACEVLGGSSPRVLQWLRKDRVADALARGTTATASLIERQRLWNLLVLEHWAQAWSAS